MLGPLEWIVKNATGLLALGAILLVGFGIVVRGIDPLAIPDKLVSDYQQQQARDALIDDHVKLGEELLDVEQLKAARGEFEAALTLDHTNAAASLGVFKARLYEPVAGGDYDPELTELRLQHLAKAHPDDAQVHAYLGDELMGVRKDDPALEQYRRAVELDPRMAHGYAGEGFVFDREGQPEQALAFYRRAVALSPDSPRYGNNLAYQLYRLGRYAEALAQYRQLLAIDGRLMLPHYTLAAVERLTGQLQNARRRGRELLDLLADAHARKLDVNAGVWYFDATDLRPGGSGVTTVSVTRFADKQLYARLSLGLTSAVLGDAQEMRAEVRRGRALAQDPSDVSALVTLVAHDVRVLTRAVPADAPHAAAFLAQVRGAFRFAGT
jgi:tetratricopeptide (TPR) repeat protein